MLHNEVQSELEIYEQDWSLRSVLVCQFECMQQTQENASSESFLKVNAWCLIKKKKKRHFMLGMGSDRTEASSTISICRLSVLCSPCFFASVTALLTLHCNLFSSVFLVPVLILLWANY